MTMRFKDMEAYNTWLAERQAFFAPLKPSDAPESTGTPDKGDSGPESKLQAKVQRWALDKGFLCFHDRSRKKNRAGWPDLVLCLPEGVVLFLELKSKSGRLSAEQKQMKLQFLFLEQNWYEIRSYKQFLDIVNQFL